PRREPMRPALTALVSAALLALALPAAAQFEPVDVPAPAAVAEAPARDLALYVGEAELMSQGAGERRAATARALAQVLVKLTGNPLAAANPVVRRALGNAAGFATAEQTSE